MLSASDSTPRDAKVDILFADFENYKPFISIGSGFDPFSVLPVASLAVTSRIFISGLKFVSERITVISGICVENINFMDFIKQVLLGIGGKHTGHGSNPLPGARLYPPSWNLSRYAHCHLYSNFAVSGGS